jgi:5,10-methylenetetrahydromethanopterin reductase
MAELPNISLRLHGAMQPIDAVALAKIADEVGFTGLWFAENAFARGILPTAAICAAETGRVQINAGVFNPFSRHPTMMAMEIGALDEIAKGRAALCVGAGIVAAAAKIGFAADKPLRALRDTLTIVRGLLRGEEVNHDGKAFSARGVKLDYVARPDIPIYLAGRGELTAKLAGEVADGLIISNMCSPNFASRVGELVYASHRAAGRSDSMKIVLYMPCAIDEDRTVAVKESKRAIGKMLPGFWSLGQKLQSAKEGLIAGTGITEAEFESAAARLQAGGDPVDILDERYVAAFSIAGTAQECLAAAHRFRAAGITEVALTFDSPAGGAKIRRLGEALAASERIR